MCVFSSMKVYNLTETWHTTMVEMALCKLSIESYLNHKMLKMHFYTLKNKFTLFRFYDISKHLGCFAFSCVKVNFCGWAYSIVWETTIFVGQKIFSLGLLNRAKILTNKIYLNCTVN